MRRDLQTVISTRTNFNIMHIEDYGGETFLSESVAISLLQDFNQALDRCCTVFIIYKIVFNYLFNATCCNACQKYNSTIKIIIVLFSSYLLHLIFHLIVIKCLKY